MEIPGRWCEQWVPEEVRTVRIGHRMYREVVRPGGGLGMVLHGEDRLIDTSHAFNRVVIH